MHGADVEKLREHNRPYARSLNMDSGRCGHSHEFNYATENFN
jgi:hypothetical protein